MKKLVSLLLAALLLCSPVLAASNKSYEQWHAEYLDMQERFSLNARNSMMGKDAFVILQDLDAVYQQIIDLVNGTISQVDEYLIRSADGYDWASNYTVDGIFLLHHAKDNTISVYDLKQQKILSTFDSRYHFYDAVADLYDLLAFQRGTYYQLEDAKHLRLLADEPPLLPARDTHTGKYGFLNYKTGQVGLPFVYDAVSGFSDGVAAVIMEGGGGYINGSGELVLPIEAGTMYPFRDGIAQLDTALIDKTGKVIFDSGCQFTYLCGDDYYLGVNNGDLGGASFQIFSPEGVLLAAFSDYSEWGSPTNYTYKNGILHYEYLLGKSQAPVTRDFDLHKLVGEAPRPEPQPKPEDSVPVFTDVAEDAWYRDAVYGAAQRGILTGKGNGCFDPGGSLTVAEAITMAVKAHAYLGGSTEPLPSTQATAGGRWYDGMVARAMEESIISQGQFTDYNRPATRAEMAGIFAAAGTEDDYTAINPGFTPPDVAESDAYGGQIHTLYRAGILTGSDAAGIFQPDRSISRCEAAAIIFRLLEPSARVQK